MSLTQLWKARPPRGGHADAVPDRLSGTIRAAGGMPCGTVLGTRRDQIDNRHVRRRRVRHV
ncbi:hypothetical protein [Streptosporangium sp. LJ11]|uniref:hypothetical protein n=1 Tax=Streptosporangium sp. LJ11 TaxID=3436927 RepID=UPI003F793655